MIESAEIHVDVGSHVGGVAGNRVDRGHVVRDDILGGQVLVDILAIVGLIVVPAGGEGDSSGNASAFPKPRPETVTPQGSTSTSKPAPSPVENTPANAVSNGA